MSTSAVSGNPGAAEDAASDSTSTGSLDPRIEAMVLASHRMMMERLEEGLEAIEEAAGSLMHELANEVWKASGADGGRIQSRILDELSRDQAIRGLIAHSDDRFQALDLRVARIEQSLEKVDVAAQRLGQLLSEDPGGMADMRERLDAVHAYLGSLGEYLNQRDRALLDWIKRADTERADHSSIGPQLEESEARIRVAVAQQIEDMRSSAEAGLDRVSTVLEQRITELTEQTWTDQLALRRDLMELSSEFNREHLQELDERLGRMTELVNAALGWSVDQVHDHIQRETLRSVEIGMADLIAALDRRFVDLNHSVIQRVEAMDRSLTERVDGIDGRLNAGLGALEESFAERAGDAVEEAVDRRLAPATDDLARTAAQLAMSAEAITGVKDDMVAVLSRAIDDRVTQLARMIRSDNRALADRLEVVEEQAAAKEAIRAVNELAAAIPGEINDALDQRLTLLGELIRRESRSYGEVVAKTMEALADRIDRTAVRIGDRFDREVETVVDQIGGTMATIASGIQRAPRNRG
jgi:DNA anti-recombination protein RmuC